jgi:multidrug resistance efflux pump
MIILYTGIVLVLFKFKLIKPRPFPIAWTALAGVLLIGGIVIWWKLSAPISKRVVTQQYVVQLVPYVKGQVLKVHAKANQPVKQGDLLLEINPEPYQYTLNQVQAQLQAQKQNVEQATAALEAARDNVETRKANVTQAEAAVEQASASVSQYEANLVKTMAADELAKSDEQIAVNLQKRDPGAISQLKVTSAIQKRQEADAAVDAAAASVKLAKAALKQSEAGLVAANASLKQAQAGKTQAEFALQMAGSNVIATAAQVDEARFNLAQCKVYAPADGYVVDWQVQEGTWVSPIRLSSYGTFVSTSRTNIVASFPQNYLVNVKAGDDVEVVLAPYPGKLFKAKVEAVIEATGEGQYDPSGNIPYASKVGSQGLLAVKIRLVDTPPDQLPLGAGGTVAIYTEEGKPVHIISKVTIRMEKWLLYVIPS